MLAEDMPKPGASDAVILAKAAKFLPKALKHAQQRPSEGAARNGFEITDHWMHFLTVPFLFGLATDPTIGAYFTRALLAIVGGFAPPAAAALLAAPA